MRKIISLLFLLCLAGCSSLYLEPSDTLRVQNKANTQKISVGMSNEVVMEIMGDRVRHT